MRYSTSIYAEAFLRAFESRTGKEADISGRFIALVQKNGDSANLPKIVREIEALLVKKSGGRTVLVESARPLQENQKREIESRFGKHDTVEFKARPDLVAGVRVIIDGEEMLDVTLKRRLDKLFSR